MAKDGLYFSGDRLFWDDPDFQTTKEKVVYAMLWQSITTDIAGVHIRNDQIDAIRVAMNISEYQPILKLLQKIKKIKTYDSNIWIKAAIWRNLGKGSYSKNQLIAVNSRLKGHLGTPMVVDIVKYYREKYSLSLLSEYPINTLCNGYPSVTVPETVLVPETETVSNLRKLKIQKSVFDDLKKEFPKVDCDAELKKADLWRLDNPSKSKTPNDHLFIRNWFERAKKPKGGKGGKTTQPGSPEDFDKHVEEHGADQWPNSD